jgi:hypothetical protein
MEESGRDKERSTNSIQEQREERIIRTLEEGLIIICAGIILGLIGNLIQGIMK